MAFATAHAVALQGAVGHVVDVQADVSPGAVGLTLVGRIDSTLGEARERVRMAIHNSGLEWPSTRRITVLLSPADLPKTGTHYDLALAVALLAACDVVPAAELRSTVLIGELTLDGGLRPVHGVLPMVLAASQRGIQRVIVPEPLAREAAMVPGMTVLGMRSLGQVVAELRGEEVPDAAPVPELSGRALLSWRGEDRLEEVDLADLDGMLEARYAVEVAAAGGHHLLMNGPKGCGKTSLAERVPGILPDLEPEEALELTALRSLAGTLDATAGLVRRPPYCAPHHDASKASLVGGGTGRVQPGQISLSHGGVLFLDEFPLFHTDVIDALREPLESGDVTIARGDEAITLPARAMVLLAANPCPCGNFHANVTKDVCRCTPRERSIYQSRVRGPMFDRIDIVRELEPIKPHDRTFVRPESSAVVRARVREARERQAVRFAGTRWRLNAQVPGATLRERWPLPDPAEHLLDTAIYKGTLTRRGVVRVHRLSLTVADLAGRELPTEADVVTALDLRTGAPLKAHALKVLAG